MVEATGGRERKSVLATRVASNETEITIAPLPPHARFSLRLAPNAAIDLRGVAGFRLDLSMNSAASFNGRLSARLGPDEWLLLVEDSENQGLEVELTAALGEAFHSLVNIGHRQVTMEVTGCRAREVINGGCPLDLDDNAFPAGTATRTIFGKAEIVLIRSMAAPIYRVECWRSFAPYVFGLLRELAFEFEAN